ncbi:hydantoinase B/oxoprolinase family protein [Consotaella aegiceratis]|uniref:hydantoinase B/oxoprolinase family protein n=1 Tax=Consotaella aegiceratis TaxID=3097961 RepID=UPI002F42A25E
MVEDAILPEVVRHGLQAVAEEMGAALIRTAYSVNIRDRRDFSCGVFDAQAQLIAQAEHIPVHLGLLSGVVGRVVADMGADLPASSMIVTNNPWLTGSHLPDVVVIAPVDHEGVRLGYVANMAHQVDVGGMAPGSLALGVSDIMQEGLRVPPMLLMRAGSLDETVLALFRLGSRTPDMVAGDLLAQAAANTIGARRLAELVLRTGQAEFDGAVTALLDNTTLRLKQRLAALDGRSVTFRDVLEWREGEHDVDLAIHVRLGVKDSNLMVDFEGTSGQVRGPVNAPRFITTSCVLYTVKAMLDPGLPSNAGLLRAIEVRTPKGSIVDADPPFPVGLCTSITSSRVCDALLGAFDQLLPDHQIAASTGSMNALIVGGTDPATGRAYSYVETYGGGQGALSGRDGADGIHCNMTNTANSPVEFIEREYPMTVLHYGLVNGSAGAGQFRGGHGLTRGIRLEADAAVTLHLDRTRHEPWGAEGGRPARGARVTAVGDDGITILPGKATVSLAKGTMLVVETAGGGGWGDSTMRDPSAARADAENGLAPRAEDAR